MDLFSISDLPNFHEFGAPPCSETFPDAFFSDDYESRRPNMHVYSYEREAKTICARCPYAARCLEYAMENPEIQGIWGGTTERQRRYMKKLGIIGLGKIVK
jgi:WhiB family transcriptional regulator, redox-sensing transcriptional regulator